MDISLRSYRRRRLVGDHAGESGVALVEFALLLPFLAILVFGTVDVGRGFQTKNRLTNMAREGAFYGQFAPTRVNGCTGDDVVDRAKAEDPSLAATATVTVQRRVGTTLTTITGCQTATVNPGDTLVVKVTSPLKVLTPLVGAITGPSVTVGGLAEVVVQG